MLSCPNCKGPIDLRKIKHEGLFATHRVCPYCTQSFDIDARTKGRQRLLIGILVCSSILTILAYAYGGFWVIAAVASYVLAAAVLVYGNQRMYLVSVSRR